jgi:microcin C transport system substrate-binding protein
VKLARFAGLTLAVAAIGLAGAGAAANEAHPRHGISVFGDLKYPPDFKHFDYVNPAAPKGGALRLYGIDSFDSLNPFILRGVSVEGIELIFDTLMARALDEPDAVYGLVAESVEVAADRSAVTFNLRPEARFHDGTPITAEDVAFSFRMLTEKGHPRFRLIYDGVARTEALGPHRIRFAFKPGEHRDLPTLLASLQIISKAYYAKVEYDRTTVESPLGSGPYRVRAVDPGRYIEYERVADYWAKDLPVNRGRYNFQTVRIDYFRDRDIAFEAFFAGNYDYREEFTSRDWATKYDDKPAIRNGFVVRETLPDETPSGVQAWFFNLRRDRFKDRRVRAALDLAFDYEWTNRNLFYGLYQRTNSMFENSDLAAHGPPSAAELALLEPLRGKVPDEVFAKPYASPITDGSGNNRDNLRAAARLFNEAGWRIKDGVLVDAKGEPFRLEFLLFEASFQRIINPYVANLKRIGVDASIRVVDVANFQNRRQTYDFDVVIERYVQPLTPGVEQRDYFGSAAADVPGSRNLAGIKDPAVDHLIEKIMAARTRVELVVAVRALDRVLMWNRYSVPQWFKGAHNIAYWNKYDRPKVPPKYDVGVVETWWFNPEKVAMIASGKAPPKP